MEKKDNENRMEKDQMEEQFAAMLKKLEEDFTKKFKDQAKEHKDQNTLRTSEHAEQVKNLNNEREAMR